MPPESRRIHNTDQLLSCTFQSLSCLPILHSYPPPFHLSSFSPLSLPCGICHTVGQSGRMAARPVPYGRCHAQVIRPNYEDICATLINEPVVFPLNLFSPSLLCPRLSSTCGLSPAPQPDVCPCTVAANRL